MTCLTTHDLTIAIDNKHICRQLNVTIKPGEIWGILGPNGCGKTTFLHTLIGLQSSFHGTIQLNENNLTQLSAKQIAQQIGILFQSYSTTFNQTVFEYCLAGRFPHANYFTAENCLDKQLVQQALAIMELDHWSQRSIQKLSGGERQRLNIATLLAQAPNIYLLDEPINHLDIRHQIKVLNHFRSLAKTQEISVVMSLHDMNYIQQFCDHVLLFFPEGKVIQGKTNDILTTENLSSLYHYPVQFIQANGHRIWKTA